MEQHYLDNTTKAGTAAGTLLTIIANINSEDLVKTGILAAVRATVSFMVTILLKALVRYFKK
ncbi:MAG: hypothetical protein JWP81_586 [Ferruginibacter sp.]|nr:hypothetical protein [Ferruginibacter sp.]